MTSEIELHDAETPWGALKGVTSVKVSPHRQPIIAELMVSGSKSLSNRALILAAMSVGQSKLSGLLKSDDTYWCIDALRRLGAQIDFEAGEAEIVGIGRTRPNSGDLYVGSAGTLARFLPPLLVAGDGGKWKITASKQMGNRPVGALFEALRDGGGEIETLKEENCYPAIVTGNSFSGGAISMSGSVSSQFISGVLIGSVQSKNGVTLMVEGGIVQSEYVQITLDVMRHFGAQVKNKPDFTAFHVAPGDYQGCDLVVEADASTATYFAALAAVTGGAIKMNNLGDQTHQPDYGFLAILERMGCTVQRNEKVTSVSMAGKLKGGFEIDMRPLSDATLTLAAIAPFADAPITMTGVAHIRHHESDRISAMCASLTKLGVPVTEHEDGLTVHPATPKFAVLNTYEDHRVAMALAVTGVAGAGVELNNPACVSKTCPDFFDQLSAIGIKTETLS